MDRIQQKLDEFFNTASAVQVEEGTWYFHEYSVEPELRKLYQEIEALRAENEALKSQVEELNHTVQQLEKVLEPITIYEWREIGETDWDFCDKLWFDCLKKSPEHDTRKMYRDICDLQAEAARDGFMEGARHAYSQGLSGISNVADEYCDQIRQADKEKT